MWQCNCMLAICRRTNSQRLSDEMELSEKTGVVGEGEDPEPDSENDSDTESEEGEPQDLADQNASSKEERPEHSGNENPMEKGGETPWRCGRAKPEQLPKPSTCWRQK